MNTPDVNPYQSPVVFTTERDDLPVTHRVSLWIRLLSTLFGVFGGLSFLFGVFAVLMMTYVLLVKNDWSRIGQMLAACSLYIGTGSSWMIAGLQYRKRRYAMAIFGTIVGLMIPVILFAIFGSGDW